MPVMIRRRRGFDAERYLDKALSVGDLVGAWMRDEKSGAVSYDQSGHNYHGTHVGVTLGQPGVPGMGMTSPLHDGLNDYTNIHSAGFANDNKLLNGGFETAGATWANFTDTVGDGALANEVGVVHEGTDAAKLTSGLTSNTNTFGDAMVSVPGDVDRFRFYTYGDGANAGRYGIYDITNGAYIVPLTSTGITAAAWGMVPVQYIVPVGCVSVRIEYWCPPVNGGVCYYDAGEVRSMDGFLGDQGAIVAWAQVANAGVWTDATWRRVIHIQVDAASFIALGRTGVNNTFRIRYTAGGVSKLIEKAALTETGWVAYGITWSAADDQMIAYYAGVREGAILTNLGTWGGNLGPTLTLIGAASTAPITIWSGNIAPALVFNEAKSPEEMLYLATP